MGRTLPSLNDNDDEGLLRYLEKVSRHLDFMTTDLMDSSYWDLNSEQVRKVILVTFSTL